MPHSHMACFSLGVGTTITLGSTTDVVCTHVAASGATAPTVVGDHYGWATGGTLTADTTASWSVYAGTATGRPGTSVAQGAGLVYTITRIVGNDGESKDYAVV